MSETFWIAIGGWIAILVPLYIKEHFEVLSRESEERRWKLDYFIPDYNHTLSNLYAAIQLWYHQLYWYHSVPPETQDKYGQMFVPRIEGYYCSKAMASRFLEDEIIAVLDRNIEAFTKASAAIRLRAYQREQGEEDGGQSIGPLWPLVDAANTEINGLFRNMLSPKALDQLLKKTKA